MTFEEQFQQAGKDGKEFRGAPFWSWNDDLDPEELRRQVRSMCESGMGGFFMHARAGLITPYMSQEYFECHRACIDEAKRLGMSAWLYDEDCWPSGSAGGMIPAKGPIYQAKTLVIDRVTGGIAPPDGGNTVCVCGYEADGDVITSFERVPDSALEDAKGKKLFHFHWKNTGYVDVLSEEAVAMFIDNTHDAFAKVFSAYFGGVIPGIFTDEPNYNVRMHSPHPPWALNLVDEFQSRRGYDIRDHLPEIYFPLGDYHKARLDFWRTVTELYVRAFSKQIHDRCGEYKLKLTGHQLCEDNLENQVRHVGAVMPHYEYMQVPGIDHLCRRIADPMLVKQVSSVAHQLGKERVLSEMFGCSGWNMSFEDQKWIGEWQYALGVNFTCQHLCLYSLRGSRKRDYPPSIYYQQPWWTQYNIVEDHFARLARALTMGKHVAQVLLIHPMESAWSEYTPLEPSPEVARLNDEFVRVSEYLQQMHVDYDYGDESILDRHATIQDSEVCVGDACYGLIVLPPLKTIRRATMDLLREWIANGGTVIICREAPSMIDGEPSEEPGVILEDQPVVDIDFEALKEAVYGAIEPSVQVFDEYGSDASTIYCHQRDLGGKQLFFFANIDNGDLRYDSVIRFSGSGKVEEWDLDTGEITELSCEEIGGFTVVEREFAPTQSRLLSFDPTQPPKIGAPERWMSADEIELSGPWRLSRSDPNAITLDYCRYRVGDGEFSGPVPTIMLGKLLAGITEETPVTLQYTFNTEFAEQRDRRFTVVMECPERFEITVNGHRIHYLDSGWWCDISFKKIDINLFAQPGENLIERTCNYVGANGRKKQQEALGVRGLWSRMYANPPDGAADPIIVPYSGEVAETIKRYNELKMGLDLESIYILGEFAVNPPQSPLVEGGRQGGGFVLTDESRETAIGDLAKQGYSFFRGTLVYETSFEYASRGEDRLLLALDRMGGVIARVFVNGQEAGSLKWRPLEADISGLVRPGANDLCIEITNSCRNLLGPHHHVGGELICVSPGSFASENEWTDAYSFVQTGLVTPPRLVYMRRE